MIRFLPLLLFLLLLSSCKKAHLALSGVGSPVTVPCSTTSYSTAIQPLDAIGYNGEIIFLYNNADTYSPWVKRMTLDGGSDSQGFPKLKERDRKSLRGHISSSDNENTKPVLSRWGQRLFAFLPTDSKTIEVYELTCSKDNYSISSHKINNIEVTIPTMEKSKFNAIAVTEFQGRMYAAAECAPDGNIVLLRTTSEDSSIDEFSWEYVCHINAAYAHIYDIVTALVPTADGDIEEALYFGTYLNNNRLGLEILRYNGTSNWTSYSQPIATYFEAGCFKLEVGELQNSGQDNSQVAIQAIISQGSNVEATAFYPATNTFGTTVKLKNHNGSMVAASAASPLIGNTSSGVPAGYQQHIYIFQGEREFTEKMDIDRYTSSIIKSTATNSSLLAGSTKSQFLRSPQADKTIDAYLADPDSRQTCALIGIVEGPPPTFIRNQSDFDALLPTVPSVLRLSSENTEGNSESYHYTIGVCGEVTGSSIDFRKLKAFKGFSIGLGIDISGSKYSEKTSTINMKLDRVFNSTITAHNNATLLYSIPLYTLYDYYYCNSKGENLYPMSVTSHLTNDDVIIYAKPVDISKEPFNIADPMDLTNWKNRFSSAATSGSRKAISLSYSFGAGSSDVSKSFEKSEDKNKGWVTREQGKVSAEALFKIVDVKAGVYGDFTQSQSHSSNLSQGMQMNYYQMDESIIKGNYGIKSYECTLFMMFENNEDSKRYYKRLIEDKLMLPDENPWILGYQISGITTN